MIIRIFLILISFSLFACTTSSPRDHFNPALYQAEFSKEDCDALALEKRFLLKSFEGFTQDSKKNFVVSDVAAGVLSLGLPNNRGGYTTSAYYEDRALHTRQKINIIENIQKEKLCENL